MPPRQRAKLPPLLSGYQRKYVQCKQRGCGRVYYQDFIPYALSAPLMWTHCGHSVGHRDYNLRDITEAVFHRLRIKELRAQSKKRLAELLE